MRLGVEQARAAAIARGPARVVAGAGTGKTAVIAERFRRLVDEARRIRSVDPRAAGLLLRSRERTIDGSATSATLQRSWL